MRISDWSSDVCSSDLPVDVRRGGRFLEIAQPGQRRHAEVAVVDDRIIDPRQLGMTQAFDNERRPGFAGACPAGERSEEDKSELESLMRRSYAVPSMQKTTNRITSYAYSMTKTLLQKSTCKHKP